MNENIVDVKFLADFFEKDIRTIQLWAKTEGMPKEDRGQYDLLQCCRWRVKKLEEKISELEKGDVTLYKLQQEYQKLRNEEKTLDLEVKKRNLLDREVVEMVNSAFIKLIIRNLNAIPPRLAKKLNGDGKMMQIIKDEIDDMLRTIAKTPINYFEETIETEISEKKQDEDQLIDFDE